MVRSARIIKKLRKNSYESLLELATEEGINASGRDEIYGCIFGRDSAITILKILKVLANSNPYDQIDKYKLLTICRNSLLKLASLQGKNANIESGEEPGKFIHEYRTEKYDHLLSLQNPWYVYPDGILRNYDSIDSTPLTLIAIRDYYKITRDQEFLDNILPSVKNGLSWILDHADADHDFLIEYEFKKDRKYGGLVVQSWTDSNESLLRPDGTFPKYPIAPVEAQGYTWKALKTWAHYFREEAKDKASKEYAKVLDARARAMKKAFNKYFIFKDPETKLYYPAQALDGDKVQIKTVTGNALLLLFATYKTNKRIECILEKKYVDDVVKRSFMPDMFEEDAGVRTMSILSDTFNPREDSYHNGSFWPKLNGMAHEGLIKWGYMEEANRLRIATLTGIAEFNSPIELYIKGEKGLLPYKNELGQTSCRVQAWSAAAVLDLASEITFS